MASDNSKKNGYYDLEERTEKFAKDARKFVKAFPKSITSFDDLKQVVRSSGSVAANYIEARESLGENDRLMKLRTCKKEAKESRLWFRLLKADTPDRLEEERGRLLKEAGELERILATIVRKLGG